MGNYVQMWNLMSIPELRTCEEKQDLLEHSDYPSILM